MSTKFFAKISKKFFLFSALLVLVFLPVLQVHAADLSSVPIDSLIKAKGSDTVYYYAPDGKRYVFPSEKIYKTWFADFTKVIEIDAELMAQIPLGGNVYYRPGVVMIKLVSSPKVYVVGENGQLHQIRSEAMAQKLYGADWKYLVDDLPESFFFNYVVSNAVEDDENFNLETIITNNPTINHNHRWKVSKQTREAETEKCRAVPAVPAKKAGSKGRATPAIPARDCAHLKNQNQNNNNFLTIISLQVSTTDVTAVVSWQTNNTSTSLVEYATSTLGLTTNLLAKSDNALVTNHSLLLTNLTPETKYYYKVTSIDANNKKTTTGVKTFVTLKTVDTTAPVISNISVTHTATSSIVSWLTNEAATSAVDYATSTLVTAINKQTVTQSDFVTVHQLSITSLAASTTYYYLVKSSDDSNNQTVSSESSFTTN